MHGGSTPSGRKSAQRKQAARAVGVYGLPREIDPHAALLEELHRTAGHVAWLERIIHAGEMRADESPTGKRRTVKLDQDIFGGGQQPSVWADLYERERKHFKDVAKTCIAVGIEERRVRMIEQQGALLAKVLRGVLADLGLADDERVPDVVGRHLRLMGGEAA